MKTFLEEVLTDLHGNAPAFELAPLAGDASDRRYYRVKTKGTLPDYILMEMLTTEGIVKSEEVTLYHDDKGELPFVNLQRFLKGRRLPVPEIHRYDDKALLMLLEDLGDTLLFNVVEEHGIAASIPLYEQAVDLLVQIQTLATEQASGAGECMAFSQRFEIPLLVWEFDHFLEFGVEKNGVRLKEEDGIAIRETFRKIASEIAEAPAVFTHRDYHSRNLIVKPESSLGFIDFQDALLGPPTYDLASLLRDSYVPLPEEVIDVLVERYLKQAQANGIPGTSDAKAFRRLFDLTALQRNLKAAGRFDFIDQVKGNPKFLTDIPRTLGYVRKTLGKYPELADLHRRLSRYAKELK